MRIYLGTAQEPYSVIALNASTGAVIWNKSDIDGAVQTQPTIHNGTLYIAGFGALYALDPATGTERWNVSIRDKGSGIFFGGGPAVVNDTVFTALGQVSTAGNYGSVLAINATTGSVMWETQTNASVGESAPTVTNHGISVGDSEGYVYSFDPETGVIQWATRIDGYVDTSAAYADGTLYYGTLNGTLAALSATSGAIVWSQQINTIEIRASPVVAGDILYTGRNKLRGLNATTGTELWNWHPPRSPFADLPFTVAPTITNNTVYVAGGEFSSVYAFTPTPPSTGYVDVDPSDLPGNGTQADPYVITNASELQAMEDDLDANYTLGTDINASGTAQWNNGSGFDPIGGDDQIGGGGEGPAFTGTFDGANHTITGLTINRSNEDFVGLFGYMTDGIIRNVSLHSLLITGSNRVGGLVGQNGGTIRRVSASGVVNGSDSVGTLAGRNYGTIRQVSASGDVTGDIDVGGLVGLNSGTIREASASGDVTGDFGVGGLVGENSGTIREASASGDVTGTESVAGLVGDQFLGGIIRGASASGDVNGSEDVGGLVGANGGTIRNVSASGNVIGDTDVGGLVAFNNARGTIQNVSSVGNVTGSHSVGGLVGDNVGTVRNVSIISNVTGDTNVGGLAGLNRGMIREASASGNVNGSSDVGGLVGLNIDTIREVSASGDVTGNTDVGGLVGQNGNIFGNGTIREASASGDVTGNTDVGGLVGQNGHGNKLDSGRIQTASASGNVTGDTDVGGLVGENNDTIRNASASGAVNGSNRVGGLVGNTSHQGTIQDTFAVGNVTGDTDVGGLVGVNKSAAGPITDAYWDVNATGQTTSAGGTPLTTAEMTGPAARTNMTGLNFNTVWATQPDDYPVLLVVLPITMGGGSVTPSTVNESTTVTHDVGFQVTDLSKDGRTDVVYVTFPNAVRGNNLSASFANVTSLRDGTDVSITSSINQVDGPDNDSVVDTVRFAVSPIGGGTVDVEVNVSLDVTWPAVETDTTYAVRAVVAGSTRLAGPTTVTSVTVVNTSAGTADLGDVNADGTINTGDVIQVQRSIVGLSTSSSYSSNAADVNNDGNVNTGDVIQIQRFIVGLSSVLD